MIDSNASGLPAGPGWGPVLLGLAAVLTVLVVLFRDSVWAMIETWSSSETYAHGFLILPISLWLVWEKRAVLQTALPRPTLAPVAVMVPVGLMWLLAELVDVRLVQEYAVVGLLILAVWACLGTALARLLSFPLAFLLLAVPVGDALTHPLMNFTADFTVGALRLTGVPVYRDGTFFSLPTGDWSVVEECSGIRYILASVTLGLLYAYLTYRKVWKRVLFVIAALLVPVVANGVRAYMIVMVGHLSGMKLATGVDHLIYGWVFFGLVIAVMFAVGAIWRDPEVDDELPAARSATRPRRLPVVMVAVVLAGALWPVLLAALEAAGPADVAPVVLQPPPPPPPWRLEPRDLWNWRPMVLGTDGSVFGFYRGGQGPVGLYLGVYRRQREGAELVNVSNQMAPSSGSEWSDKEISTRRIRTPDGPLDVKQDRIVARGGGRRLLVWNWYRIGAVNTSNPYVAKLVEAGYRLAGRAPSAALIAVAVPYADEVDAAAGQLDEFIAAMWSPIAAELDRAIGRGPGT